MPDTMSSAESLTHSCSKFSNDFRSYNDFESAKLLSNQCTIVFFFMRGAGNYSLKILFCTNEVLNRRGNRWGRTYHCKLEITIVNNQLISSWDGQLRWQLETGLPINKRVKQTRSVLIYWSRVCVNFQKRNWNSKSRYRAAN